ncbi:hypothetical protein B0T26DRAFT_698197 [Lasiosphaeria miniovina]|uniref:Uncharacterized protein n=1 Tax=Lasiosphaeria miniovina TaxID=1954250 RepID=A0AA40E812_9PEZI|nr:uncharacterized protein B0T26DRAFT_698197 [Lasiosphaeria miniovina]KAK0728497.1 hypothetical protein B0T26DRAFT_698197 [Lasiosphaeria miniovina]
MCARPVWTAKIPGEPVGELPAEQHMLQWIFWCIERLLGTLETRETEPERLEAGGGRRETGCGPQRLVAMEDIADSLARLLTALFLCSPGRLFQHLTFMARERLRTAANPEFQEPGWERFVSLVMFESFMPCPRRLDDRTCPASASASCICPFSCLVAALKEAAKSNPGWDFQVVVLPVPSDPDASAVTRNPPSDGTSQDKTRGINLVEDRMELCVPSLLHPKDSRSVALQRLPQVTSLLDEADAVPLDF